MMPMEPRLDIGILVERIQRLMRLDTTVFAEVRQDPAATLPAIIVLVVSTFLAAIGGWLWWWIKDFPDTGDLFLESVIFGSLFSIALWVVWLLIAWVILTQMFREDADWQEMLRTMGLASAPLALMVAMFIPEIGWGIGLASLAFFFGLTTIAVQVATNVEPAKALVANVAGFALWAIVLGLLVSEDNWLAPGFFLFNIADSFS